MRALKRALLASILAAATSLAVVAPAPAATISVAGQPEAISWGDGHIDVFARGSDRALWHKPFVATNGGWGNWESLGGEMKGKPSVVKWGPNELHAFVRGRDDQLYYRRLTNFKWGQWKALPGVRMKGSPEAVSWGSGHIDVFVRAQNDEQWHIAYSPSYCGGWCGWENHQGILTSDPEPLSWGDQHLDVFHRGTDWKLYHRWFGAGGWSAYHKIDGHQFHGKPQAISWGRDHIDVFAKGLDEALVHTWFVPSACGLSGGWCGWGGLGGDLDSDTPGLVNWSGQQHIAAYVHGPQNAVYDIWFQSQHGGWGNWWRVSDPGTIASPPGGDENPISSPTVVSMKPGHIDAFWRHPDGTLRHRWYDNGWSADPQHSLGMPNPDSGAYRYAIAQNSNPGDPPPQGWNWYTDSRFTAMGVNALRFTIPWNAQPGDGNWNRITNALNGAKPPDRPASEHKQVLLSIFQDGAPPTPAEYRTGVQRIVNEFGPRVDFWGAVNEPNLWFARRQADGTLDNSPSASWHGMSAVTLADAYTDQMILAVGTSSRVISPEFVQPLLGGYTHSATQWVQAYTAAGGTWGRAAGLHPYRSVEDMDYGSFKGLVDAVPGGLEVWLTEVGVVRYRRNSDGSEWPGHFQRPEQDIELRVDWLMGTMMPALQSRIRRLYYYVLFAPMRTPEFDPTRTVFDTGLLRPNSHLYPTYDVTHAYNLYCRRSSTNPGGCPVP